MLHCRLVQVLLGCAIGGVEPSLGDWRAAVRSIVVAVACFTAAGCLQHIAPPPAPDESVPEVTYPSHDPPTGRTRVVIDVTNGPSQVNQITSRSSAQEGSRKLDSVTMLTLCRQTPCVVDLEPGRHELVVDLLATLGRREEISLNLASDATILKHSLGHPEERGAVGAIGMWVSAVGFPAAVVGGAFTIGDNDSSIVQGLLFGGLATLAVGIVMQVLDPPTVQQGTTHQFPAPDPAVRAQPPLSSP